MALFKNIREKRKEGRLIQEKGMKVIERGREKNIIVTVIDATKHIPALYTTYEKERRIPFQTYQNNKIKNIKKA